MATTPRRFVLNAPSLAGNAGAVTYTLVAADGSVLVAPTGSGVVALAFGYRVLINYDLSWPTHGEFIWLYDSAQVASETFDFPASSADMRKVKAAVYDTAAKSGNAVTLSDGATLTYSDTGRAQAGG